jgi:VanZ family protein
VSSTRLRLANLVLAAVLAGQAALIVALGASLTIPITAQWADGPPGSALLPPETLFDLSVRWAVAAFLLMAALDHLLVATPRIVGWYERNLARGINDARWIEYSFSASLMVVLIATFSGVTDLRALVAVAGVNAAMILFGLLMERSNLGRSRDELDWLPFRFGCLAGAVPWVVIGISLVGAEVEGSVPGFVWGIFVSLFLFYNSFAVNMWLQYRGVGPWRSYVFGEWGYLVLSLTAKSALAWQIYAGALAG